MKYEDLEAQLRLKKSGLPSSFIPKRQNLNLFCSSRVIVHVEVEVELQLEVEVLIFFRVKLQIWVKNDKK